MGEHKLNGAKRQPTINLLSLAERCRIAGNAVEMLPADSKLFAECSEAFEAMDNIVASMPEVVRRNRAHQYEVTIEGVAKALEAVAFEYERGTRPFATPQGALRAVAGSLRADIKAQQEPAQAPSSIIKGSLQ